MTIFAVAVALLAPISIHTPAKGVTKTLPHLLKIAWISIHTPAKGVTIRVLANRQIRQYFNPHSREGSDDYYKDMNKYQRISIHTPAKGVTWLM